MKLAFSLRRSICFLSDLSPHLLVSIVGAGIAVLAILSPVTFVYGSLQSIFVIILFFVVFWLGSFSITSFFKAENIKPCFFATDRHVKVFYICLLLSMLGIAIRVYDFYWIRGISLADGVVSMRLSLQSLTYQESSDLAQAGMFSAVGAILYGFIYPLLIMLVYLWESLDRSYKFTAVFVSLYPAIESFLNGGIWGAVFLFLFFVFAVLHKRYIVSLNNFNRSGFFLFFCSLLMVFVAVVFVGGALFIERVEQIHGDFATYFYNSTTLSRPSDNLLYLIDLPIVGGMFFSFYWFSSYLIQGVAEFSYLYDNFDTEFLAYGAKQFFVVNKFFSIFGVVDFSSFELLSLNPRPGRYQTFFGDVYLDFGILGGLLESFLLGLVSGYIYVRRKMGFMSGIIFYPFIQAGIVSGFLINCFSGSKFYFLVALLVVWFLFKFFIRSNIRLKSSL